MSTFSRPRSRRQLRHPGARSASHQADKAAAEARRELTPVFVPAARLPSPERPFTDLGLLGHEFLLEGDEWRKCADPEDFSDSLESRAKALAWFYQQTTRRGKPARMRRKTPTPIEIVTVTFPPWLSDWALARLRSGDDPRASLAAIRTEWLEATMTVMAGKRHLIGYAFHSDTSDLHFDLVVSRQDGEGGRIGDAGLGLAGPWTVGVDRQLRADASIASDKKRRFAHNIAKFRERKGAEAIPLDVLLARALDNAAANVLGEELTPFIKTYAASVPRLEREHRKAALEVLDRARRRVLGDPSQPEPPEVEL